MLSAAILAGGRASRFDGLDKSALRVGGRSILEYQLGELAGLADDVMLVVGNEDGRDSFPLVDGGVRIVRDRVAGRGPLAGLDAALAEGRHETVLLVACDMPFISARLLAYLGALTADADAVIPLTERGYHPLCAAYTRACREAVTRRLSTGRLSMQGLLDDVRVRSVTGPELDAFGDPSRLLANINTAEEYAELVGLNQTSGRGG